MKSSRAFTLVEVLVAMFIFSMLLGGIFMVLNTGELTYNVDVGIISLQRQARQAMDTMVNELRNAKSQSIPSGGASITFDKSVDTGVMFYVNGSNQLVREFPSGTTRVLCNKVSSINFCCHHDNSCDTVCSAADSVQIQLNTANTVRNKNINFAVKGQVNLRNE